MLAMGIFLKHIDAGCILITFVGLFHLEEPSRATPISLFMTSSTVLKPAEGYVFEQPRHLKGHVVFSSQ